MLGSGGVLLLPDQPGSHPHQLVLPAKGRWMYEVDRDQMTLNNLHYCLINCTIRPPNHYGVSAYRGFLEHSRLLERKHLLLRYQ